MKHNVMRLVLCVCVLALLVVRELHADLAPELMIDSFEDQGPAVQYQPFAEETVTTQAGYGIYFKRANGTVSRVARLETDKALHIQYALPPYFAWGNWLSIRKAFLTPLDLSGYQGIKIDVKILTPSNARLRLTLADVATLADAQIHGADEMWWFDVPREDVLKAQQQWVTLQVPFRAFYRAYGEGTRHNDYRLDVSKIVAYELNVISAADESPQGAFLVKALRAYTQRP